MFEREGHPVERSPMRQCVLHVTAYAGRLVEDLDDLDWPEITKDMQRNWIGHSVGAELDFDVDGLPGRAVRVYTTRPETVCGVSYLFAPEWDGVLDIVSDAKRAEVEEYVRAALPKSGRESPRVHRRGRSAREDRRVYRRVRAQLDKWGARADLGCRLRPRRVWDRGIHGRAGA